MKSSGMFFVLLHISFAMLLFMFFIILRMKPKKQIHYAFLANIIFAAIWCLGNILEVYAVMRLGRFIMEYVFLWFIGLCFLPVSVLFTGVVFAHTKVKLSRSHLLFLVLPVISLVMLLTNEHHYLFFVKFSLYNRETVYGSYFVFHSLYSYILIVTGLFYLLYFSIKNSGFFSRQSILILLGVVIPFSVNVLFTLNIIPLPTYSTVVAFTFSITCFMAAILKYGFLNIVPVALQTVVDHISDCFIVINDELKVIDFNKTFLLTFESLVKVKRNDSLMDVLNAAPSLNFSVKSFLRGIEKAKVQKEIFSFEKHIVTDRFNRYFTVELTPIISNDNFIGTIILLKDITQSKKDLETIKEKQAILMEQERLASLGQLVGGIAHNMKTPIMSLAGGIEALKDLAAEYDESIEDPEVTWKDHHEIAGEMMEWLIKMKPYCSYMSDIISTVKGQTVQFNTSSAISFTLDELVKRIELLMKHELKKYHCVMNICSDVDMNTEISGDVNSLVQIFDNLIINAIHAYEGENGNIDFTLKKEDNDIVFMLRDYGTGIKPEIKDRLFKEMVTTKGKDGTGLGLYMSYANIKGRFGGNMWFESETGKGTTFYITIPHAKHTNDYMVQEAAE